METPRPDKTLRIALIAVGLVYVFGLYPILRTYEICQTPDAGEIPIHVCMN